MSAYWNSYNNALAAGQTTIDAYEEGQRRKLGRAAGNALAGGDYSGAARTLYEGGEIDGGAQIDRMDQQRQMQTQQAEQQATEQRREGLKQAATAIRTAPPEQRAQVYQSTIRPTLQQLGMPEELLAQIDQSPMDDASLDAFIAALGGERPGVKYLNTSQGVVAIRDGDVKGALAFEAEQEPERVEGPDGIYERGPDGQWKKVASFGAAPKMFAPQRPRGGGAPAAPGVSSYNPAAIKWD